MEKGEPRPLFPDAEKIQLGTQLAVVPAPGLLNQENVLIQQGLFREGSPVYPLQHLILLAAPPVGARQVHQLHRLQPAGAGHVGAHAQVREFPLAVAGKGHVRRQVFDQFDLVFLAGVPEKVQRLRPGEFKALKGQVGLDDCFHFLFNFSQVAGSKGFLRIKIVVKPVGDGRPNGQAGARKKPLHRLGHDVGRAVAVDLPPFFIIKGQKFNPGVPVQGRAQVRQPAVHFGCQGFPGQAGADAFGDFQQRNTGRVLSDRTIGQGYLDKIMLSHN